MDNPLITVIIPVYNVEKYLPKCVESVVNQTYKELEIILVDDGATDKSGMLCDECAKNDARIKVIHKPNGGLSSARNAALDIFKGEYVTYIDSDDHITDDYVAYLYKVLNENDADVSMCQLKKIYNDSEGLDMAGEQIAVLSGSEAIENYLYQRSFTASAHCKLYKRFIFDDLRYPEGYYYEDMAIICKIMDRTKRVVVSNQQKYYYIQRNDSIMGESFNPKKMQRIEVANWVRDFIILKYPQIKKAADARCFLAATQTFREVPLKAEYNDNIRVIWEEIKRDRFKVLTDSRAKLSHRVIALSTYAGKRCLKLLGILYTKRERAQGT